MNPVLFLLFVQPYNALIGLLPQENSGLPWGWILLFLLILALAILWWLLGPGAKRRRRKMADLPKPGQTTSAQAPKPALPAGLPISPAAPPPVATPPAATPPAATTPIADPSPPAVTTEESPVEESAPAEAIPEASNTDDETAGEADTPVDGEDTEAVAAPVEPDNLRKIEGIGPKVAGILVANGIATFAQLAESSVERLMEILEAEGLKFMKPDTWPEQAAFAAKDDWEGLQNLQDQLKGGRRVEE